MSSTKYVSDTAKVREAVDRYQREVLDDEIQSVQKRQDIQYVTDQYAVNAAVASYQQELDAEVDAVQRIKETKDVYDYEKVAAARLKEQERLRHGQLCKERDKYEKDMSTFLEIAIPKIQSYTLGDRLGPKNFGSLRLSDIKNVKIALFGPTGAGKTCFINMVERVIEGKSPEHCIAQPQGAAKEGGLHLESYLNHLRFRLLDTRGFFEEESYKSELDNILAGRILVDEYIARDSDIAAKKQHESLPGPAGKLPDRVHGLIFILDKDDARFDTYRDRMVDYRKKFKTDGYSPVSVVTFTSDRDLTAEEMKDKTQEAAAIIGSPVDCTFILRNHVANNTELTIDSKVALVKAIETALTRAEKYIKIASLAAGSEPEESTGLSLDEFLRKAGEVHNWSGDDVSSVKSILDAEDIYDVLTLKQYWPDIKDEIKKWGIQRFLGKEIEKINIE